MTLIELRDLLLTIGVPVYHYEAHKSEDKYIVWAEDGQRDSFHADDEMDMQVLQGTIDYFTKTEFDPIFNKIQETLKASGVSWRLNSIQNEDDTGYIHYEWTWEVENLIGEDEY